MKVILFFIFVINGMQLSAQTSDTINWSPCYQLQFGDFQGAPDSTKIDLANSRILITYSYRIVNDQLKFNVNCFFLKKVSWTKFDMPTLMEHEQGHFDIAKLFALKLEQRFREYKVTNTVQRDLSTIYDLIMRDLYAMADLFDARIKGAKDDIPQKEFIAGIKRQIPTCKK